MDVLTRCPGMLPRLPPHHGSCSDSQSSCPWPQNDAILPLKLQTKRGYKQAIIRELSNVQEQEKLDGENKQHPRKG